MGDECGNNMCPEGTICRTTKMNQYTCECPARGCNNLNETLYLSMQQIAEAQRLELEEAAFIEEAAVDEVDGDDAATEVALDEINDDKTDEAVEEDQFYDPVEEVMAEEDNSEEVVEPSVEEVNDDSAAVDYTEGDLADSEDLAEEVVEEVQEDGDDEAADPDFVPPVEEANDHDDDHNYLYYQ